MRFSQSGLVMLTKSMYIVENSDFHSEMKSSNALRIITKTITKPRYVTITCDRRDAAHVGCRIIIGNAITCR